MCVFLIISRSVLLRMKNVPDKIFGEHHNTFWTLSFLSPKIVSFTNNMEKKNGTVRQVTGDDIIRRLPFASWIRLHNTLRICNNYSLYTVQKLLRRATQCYVYNSTAYLISPLQTFWGPALFLYVFSNLK